MLPAAVRRWLHRPKRSDPRLLSQFFYADERVTQVVREINCLDVETDPQQYLVLLNQLHLSQAELLAIIEQIMDECIPKERHGRDYVIKFPEDLLVDSLRNHMLFAAECLMARTYIDVDEADGVRLRPLAKDLLCSLELVRTVLREQSLSQHGPYSEPVRRALIRFDILFAEFELSYVSSLVSVKSPEEIYRQQEIVVLFCETVARALKLGYLTQEMIDGYEPQLMFTIPRLAIISGLLIYPDGPLNLERKPEEISRVFSPFYVLLRKIRDLLRVLSKEELYILEKRVLNESATDSQASCEVNSADFRGSAAPHICLSVPRHPGQESKSTRAGAVAVSQHSRWLELRARYRTTEDMIHTLFVCVSGVADQLQTNFASDLRSILKTVFAIVTSRTEELEVTDTGQVGVCVGPAVPRLTDCALCSSGRQGHGRQDTLEPPEWVPDSTCSHCMACRVPFTFLRRRHHCRSCGKIFCSRCSSHLAPLPHFRQLKPVRICTHCYTTHLPSTHKDASGL
ncbi:PREDICTED: lateral signaling target protein 2 homolog isoform X1 [Gekko japonicus]|uniref:Lateral signaling target protein 2 homolog isoform X1 n=1 Tax=Gekko japonicus TaxID=146911 RepID=A0ABM1K2S4_GEKJA|nr:PREDICTED: lateral signaling target protein 2 homolog isoform X1 [Gekko japonicus]